MQAYNTTVQEMESIPMPENVRFKSLEQRGKHVRFTLTVNGPGRHSRRSYQGRRISAACWHAHYAFLREFFERFPDRRVRTSQSDYRGLSDFSWRAPSSGDRNIGSQIQPLRYRDACDCEYSPE